jgi:hypothetical protein
MKMDEEKRAIRRSHLLSAVGILGIALFICALCLGIFLSCNLNKVDDRITELTEQYAVLQHVVADLPGGEKLDSTVEPNLEFLKEEIKGHQEFIERERQFLVWMLGVILIGAGLVIAFFSFKTKKSIEKSISRKYEEEYEREFKRQLSKELHNDETLTYLQKAIGLEANAFSKRVLFIKQPKSEALDPQIALFKDFLPEKHVLSLEFDHSKLNRLDKYENYDIIVYEVDAAAEGEKEGDDTESDTKRVERALPYRRIDDYCSTHKKQCVLLCSGRINTSILDVNHTTTVNFGSKLRETLYLLLYILPKDD